MTYYDDYHPLQTVLYNQPAYSIFQLNSPLVYLKSTYTHDIKVAVPALTPVVLKLSVDILESVAELTRKLNDNFEV